MLIKLNEIKLIFFTDISLSKIRAKLISSTPIGSMKPKLNIWGATSIRNEKEKYFTTFPWLTIKCGKTPRFDVCDFPKLLNQSSFQDRFHAEFHQRRRIPALFQPFSR